MRVYAQHGVILQRKYKLSYKRRKWNKRDCKELLLTCKSLQDIKTLKESLLEQKLNLQIAYENKSISYNQFNKRSNKLDYTISYFGSNLVSVFIETGLQEILNKNNPQSYRYKARFIIRPCDLPSIKGYELLQKLGYYNKESNPNGVVMDHRYSIKSGISNNVKPEILGKLFNCEFLTYKDNLLKSCNNSINLSDLIAA